MNTNIIIDYMTNNRTTIILFLTIRLFSFNISDYYEKKWDLYRKFKYLKMLC